MGKLIGLRAAVLYLFSRRGRFFQVPRSGRPSLENLFSAGLCDSTGICGQEPRLACSRHIFHHIGAGCCWLDLWNGPGNHHNTAQFIRPRNLITLVYNRLNVEICAKKNTDLTRAVCHVKITWRPIVKVSSRDKMYCIMQRIDQIFLTNANSIKWYS